MGRRLSAIVVTSWLAACSSSEPSAPPGTPATPETPGPTQPVEPPTPKGEPPAPPGSTEPPPPASPAIAFIGRFARDGETATFGWPGTRIAARFTGTSVAVKLSETPLYEGPSRLDVSIDGKATVLTLEEGEKTYAIGKDLAAGDHLVELTRRTEGQVGITRFLGFDFGAGKLLAPPPAKKRRIEFLGDSNTTGYGIEGNGPECPFSAATQNFGKTYAARVATALDADAIAIAYSGKGVIQNNDRTDPILFEDLFRRTVPESESPAWDFAKAPAPDAVLINLGSNDYAQPTEGVVDPPQFAAFKAKFGKLVALTREKYAQAHIFLVVSPTQSDSYPEGFDARSNQKKAYSELALERRKLGDTRVHFLDLGESTEAERDACDYHPGLELHERMATAVVAEIKKVTGW